MIIFHTHRIQVATLGLLNGLFGLSGVAGAFRDQSRLRKASGALGGLYFLYQGCGFLRLAFRSEALVLGREGILDRVGLPPAGYLPWEHIAAAEVLTLPLGLLVRKYVAIRLDSADPEKGGRTRPAFEPPMLKAYAALIPEYALEERVEEVVETLNLYIEDAEERDELQSLLHAPGKPAW
jgi:hypothetical protein